METAAAVDELDSSMVVGEISSGVAAVAALLAVYYSRATVAEARGSRREFLTAHAEAMGRQAHLLQEMHAAHEHEMDERRRATELELWVRRLARFALVQEHLGETIDCARSQIAECARTGTRAHVGIEPTPLTRALLLLGASLAVLERLNGPELPHVASLVDTGLTAGTLLSDVLGGATTALADTRGLAASEPSLREPQW